MANIEKRPLKVFLCHASGDKPPVRELYNRLTTEGVDAWLDKERLLPGQDWRLEIPKAVRDADVVVVCLSKSSITKEGYVQKEIRFALDIAEEKPEGTIFLIPARLEDCVVPDRLNRWQWVDLYEDDGFIMLLRSLKLRADAVDATVEPTSYVDSNKEIERRLEQLYTEGLAAFYTEDWDKACQRFQSILSERPNHKNASEKLEEAKRQRDLAKLYEQAIVAVRSDDWMTAIQILEELSQKSAGYKDSEQLLTNARKHNQLNELYAEAKALHAGKQWEAVVKVFEQISSIEPDYPDADELLPSAQKEVAEHKRLAELNDQYSKALREMDAGNWYESRRLLESVHKSETGFLETEKLLKKVEKEIVREEQRRKQNDQINTFYEQAHGLLRSKKWRNALDKMGEIRKLDEHFPDTDRIAEKAQREIVREEQEAERQNKLAALYAEAVKFLKEEKYQEALDKWGEVKAIDPKYPDRQRVGKTAKKKLSNKGEKREIKLPLEDVSNNKFNLTVFLATIFFGSFILLEQNINQWFQVDIPTEVKWFVRGMVYGLTTVFVVKRVMTEWDWKAYLIFGISWGGIYLLTDIFFRQPVIAISLLFSFAPVVSIFITGLWIERKIQWRTYVVIFLGWLLAWTTNEFVADYLTNPYRWMIGYTIAGAVGIWINVDVLKSTPFIFKTNFYGGTILAALNILIIALIYQIQTTQNSFAGAVGMWEATDTDGSTMFLYVYPVSENNYKFIYLDEEAGVCNGNSGVARFEKIPVRNQITSDEKFQCNPPDDDIELIVKFTWTYVSDGDQLIDEFGILWHRFK